MCGGGAGVRQICYIRVVVSWVFLHGSGHGYCFYRRKCVPITDNLALSSIQEVPDTNSPVGGLELSSLLAVYPGSGSGGRRRNLLVVVVEAAA